jgi:hypothetical protein
MTLGKKQPTPRKPTDAMPRDRFRKQTTARRPISSKLLHCPLRRRIDSKMPADGPGIDPSRLDHLVKPRLAFVSNLRLSWLLEKPEMLRTYC